MENIVKNNKLIAESLGWEFTLRSDGNYNASYNSTPSWDIIVVEDFEIGGCYDYSHRWNEFNLN